MAMDMNLTLSELPTRQFYTDRPRRLLQNRDTLLSQVQLGISILASVSVLLGLAWWRDGTIQVQYRYLGVIIALLMLVFYQWRGVFRRFNGLLNGSLRIARAWLAICTLLLLFAFLTKSSDNYSRAVIGGWFGLAYLLQLMGYSLSFHIAERINRRYGRQVRVLVIGSRWLAEHLVSSLSKNAWIPDRVVGVVDEDQQGLSEWESPAVPYLGSLRQVKQLVRYHEVTRVYIALPITCSERIERIYAELADSGLDIIWVPDIFAMQLLNHSVREINGLPLITLSESPLMLETQALCKALLDKLVAASMLVLLSPLLLAIALAVRLSSPGPVIFRQKRHGWDGRIIEVWKFRSMYVHRSDGVVAQAQRYDRRITPVGRFIRRTSLDELPQLFNVVQGHMSLVGPRPHAIEHNDFYSSHIRSYMLRHRIKPGITGLAQVRGLRGETETIEKMLRRVEADLEYINRWSVWLDIKILLKTPLTLFSKDIY